MKRRRRTSPLLKPCQTADELHRWLFEHLHLRVPRAALCPGHQPPFEYLHTAYFEPTVDQVIWAPRGGGKTRLAAAATVLDLLHKPGISIRILGGSLDQSLKMWDYLLPDVQRLCETARLAAQVRSHWIRLDNGSSVAAIPQSQRAVRGMRVQKLRCDEVELFDPDIWEAAQLVTRSLPGVKPVTGAVEALSTLHRRCGLMQQVVDGAPARGARLVKWCLLDVLEQCPDERHCATCPLWDECRGAAKTLAGGFFPIDDAIRMKSRVSVETWQTEMLCRRPSVRGCVFPGFNPDVHCRQASLPDSELFLAIDFGFAAPFVCLWVRCDARGRVHVIDEYLQQQQTIDRHLEQINSRGHGPVTCVFCDPAGGSRNEQTAGSNVDVLASAGFRVRTRPSRIVEGIEQIRTALTPATGQPRLFVHPRCTRLIDALRAYHYPPTGEIPVKDGTHDHPIDALRYFYVNRFKPGNGVVVKRY